MNFSSVSGKNWLFKKFNSSDVIKLTENFSLSQIVAKLLSIRKKNIDDIGLFLDPKIKNLLPNPLYLKDMKKTLPCAAYLNGEYGIKNLYAGVPIIIGNTGVEKVVELDLGKDEKKNFDLSIKAVKDLMMKAKEIDPELEN